MSGIGKFSVLLTTGALIVSMADTAARADAIEDFYRGKQIRIIIGFGTGGTSDIFARTIQRHLGRHIPGGPTFVPQNMPGAGGIKAANYIYNVAPKDGTAFGTFSRTVPLEPLVGKKKAAEFDALKFTWLGSPSNEVSTCASWHTSKVKVADDLRKHELIVGSTGAASVASVFPRIFNSVLGTKFKVILGYTNSVTALKAMEQGETQGFCAWGWVPMLAQHADWYRDKKINVLFQIGLAKHPEHPDVPLVLDMTKTPEDRAVLEFIVAPQTFARPFAAPPALPADRAAALQRAFNAMVKDKAFVADAEKQKLEIQLVTGEQTLNILKKLYKTPPATVARAKAAMK
jgi:tripartite-type tricarboxylate transporter receptor subunit TctC